MRAILAFVLGVSAMAQHRVVAIAHRGEHLQRPENTMPAFEEAIRVGADFIEVDVQTTADGHLVIMHDATLDRTTNGHGRVDAMTLAQVQSLDAGAKKSAGYAATKVPAFDQVLDLARGKIGVYVDVKNAAAADLVAHIERHQMSEHVVIYCRPELCGQIAAANAKLKVMPEAQSVAHAGELIGMLHPAVLAFDARDFTGEVIAAAKRGRAEIYVDRMGATDNPEGWQAAIDAGADGIQTDRPGPLVEYLRAKGYR
jgi:glycerophosphoryl diester phosphodiesterase